MRASFPYERQNDDELDLAVGDIIDVLHDVSFGNLSDGMGCASLFLQSF